MITESGRSVGQTQFSKMFLKETLGGRPIQQERTAFLGPQQPKRIKFFRGLIFTCGEASRRYTTRFTSRHVFVAQAPVKMGIFF